MSWKVFKYNGHYIMGELIGSHKTGNCRNEKS